MLNRAMRDLRELILGRRRRLAKRNAQAAAQLLSRRFGRPIGLKINRRFHLDTTRCQVDDPAGELPAEVIIKRPQAKGQRFAPDDPNPLGPSFRLFNEWASLEVISDHFSVPGLCPRLLAGHRDEGYLVIEVVGEHSLHDLLCGKEPQLAREGLCSFAKILGQLQAASVGQIEDYRRQRDRLGPRADPRHQLWGCDDWLRQQTAELKDNFSNLGFRTSAGFDEEMAQVASAIADPGELTVFTHGDPCPDNLRLAADQATLIDFEYGGIGPGLNEGCYFRMLFPTTFQANRLPDRLVAELESVYRSELVKGCPAAADDRLFTRGILNGCVTWLTVTLASWSLQPSMYRGDRLSALDSDQSWGLTSNRQVALARLRAFICAADTFDALPALCETFSALEKRLLVLWPEVDEMPCYPAFRRS